jgi:hypothetical protein
VFLFFVFFSHLLVSNYKHIQLEVMGESFSCPMRMLMILILMKRF